MLIIVIFFCKYSIFDNQATVIYTSKCVLYGMMNNQELIIKISNLTKVFDKSVLNNLHLNITKGEILGNTSCLVDSKVSYIVFSS